MGKRRRRGITSDWILRLQETRASEALRQELPYRSRDPQTLRTSERNSLAAHNQVPAVIEERSSADPYMSEQNIEEPVSVLNDVEHVSMTEPQHDGGDALCITHVADEHADCMARDIHQSSNDSEIFHGQTNINSEHVLGNDAAESLAHPTTPAALAIPSAGYDGTTAEGEIAEETIAAVIELLESRRNKWENRHLLSAVVAVVGSVRFTVKQYEYTRNVLKDVTGTNTEIWPPYSTIQRYFHTVLNSSMPRSKIVHLPKKRQSRADQTQDYSLEPDHAVNAGTAPVRIVYPSAWAMLDVSTTRMFADQHRRTGSLTTGACLERSQTIQFRSGNTDPCRHLFVDHNGENVQCYPSAVILVSAQSPLPQFGTPFYLSRAEHNYFFHATVAASWVVNSTSSTFSARNRYSSISDITSFEKQIVNSLSVAHTRSQSPSERNNAILPGDFCT